MTLTSEQLDNIRLIMYIICPLSLCFNLSLIYCVVTIKFLNKTINHLQMCLAICEGTLSVLWILGNNVITGPLQTQITGAIFQFCLNASVGWNFVISLYCFLTVQKNLKRANWYYNWYHIYCWTFATSVTVLVFVFEAIWDRGYAFGDATFEIWISGSYSELRIWLYYFPLWLHFIGTLGIYVYIFRKTYTVEYEVNRAGGIQTVGAGTSGYMSTGGLQSNGAVSSGLGSEMVQTVSVEAVNPSAILTSAVTAGTSVVHSTNYAFLDRSSFFERQSSPSDSAASPRTGPATMKHQTKKLVYRSCFITASFFICWTPATVGRIMTLIDPNAIIPFWLYAWIAFGFSISGLINPLVFYATWYSHILGHFE
ncbi:hypothetical protein BCR33DRAFT_853609 [Rhizoclosmatium globosum]|uniref:G-protein coupled receptors family 2 profile 2 domain-containing protein n=1 Tax=Rhizoclosmatium globosum TaxID=329046 RepID=A0A1Y2BW93_9FUNG|nr:hypothetical protein BCR33DRAFT_853609 [Rhizoclosmatium globosum]|eukprot:ORY39030.1 hypothetical protein BCR33DRAFT_853609 [Rhizoclosmatium globosum]